MAEELKSTYRERIENYEAAISYRNRLINYIALLRLLTLVAIVYFLITGIKSDQLIFYFASFLMAVTFLVLVNYHRMHNERRELLRELRDLNSKEISCLDHHYDACPDGSEFIDRHHPWSFDLDLFGKGSLYQYLNRTSTLHGKRILANSLTASPEKIKQISERQEIIKDLKDRLDFRQVYVARAQLINMSSAGSSAMMRFSEGALIIS